MSSTIKAPTVTASLVFVLLQLSASAVRAETTIAQQPQSSSPGIPTELQVPSGQQPVVRISAKGSQIYVCQAKNTTETSAQYEWTLKAPAAVLFNQRGQYLGRHYGGPTWEATDGSKVVAAVKSKANAPQSTAIPWLLLEARSREGTGIFSRVSWIQRINTVGGKAPVEGCSATTQNRQIRVGYAADYVFYNAVAVK